MWRTLVLAAVAYAFGHPSLDGRRPVVLDRPLKGFYQNVNRAARDGRRTIATLSDACCMRFLMAYVDEVDTQVRPAN
jgi:hypothetical protein